VTSSRASIAGVLGLTTTGDAATATAATSALRVPWDADCILTVIDEERLDRLPTTGIGENTGEKFVDRQPQE